MNNYNIFIILIISIILLIFIIVITCYFNKIEKYTSYGLNCIDTITTITPSISSEINGDYEILKFIHNSSSDETVYEFTLDKSIIADILIVGGGGGGGSGSLYQNSEYPNQEYLNRRGGGGGGGVLYMIDKLLEQGITYKITVGDGGASDNSGYDSYIKYLDSNTYVSFDGIELVGFGGGTATQDGGSGGGAFDRLGSTTTSGSMTTGNALQGNTFWDGTTYIAGGFDGKEKGGGGGAGEGQSRIRGGEGREVNITGASLYYGSGGGGSMGGEGGPGGGGDGGKHTWVGGNLIKYYNGQEGTPDTGGGGGGSYQENAQQVYSGGKGGSGIVIIKKKIIPTTESVITNLGDDVVLWHDGRNIDGSNNSTLSDGGVITNWHNKSNYINIYTGVPYITTSVRAPLFNQTDNGVLFDSFRALSSDINLNVVMNHTVNIFIVWKPSEEHTSPRWLWSQAADGYDRSLIMYSLNSGTTHYLASGPSAAFQVSHTFTANTTVIVNCEYNTNIEDGGFYINNSLIRTFLNQTPRGTINTVFGAKDKYAVQYSNPTGITGDIYEIIIVSRLLTTTERTNISDYLDNKWIKKLI